MHEFHISCLVFFGFRNTDYFQCFSYSFLDYYQAENKIVLKSLWKNIKKISHFWIFDIVWAGLFEDLLNVFTIFSNHLFHYIFSFSSCLELNSTRFRLNTIIIRVSLCIIKWFDVFQLFLYLKSIISYFLLLSVSCF